MARAGMAGRVKVRTANMKMFDAEVRTLVGIFNDAWSDNWGFVPFTQAEIDHASKAFGPVIVPELAVFVEVDDEAVAFIVALTNLNEAVDGVQRPAGARSTSPSCCGGSRSPASAARGCR